LLQSVTPPRRGRSRATLHLHMARRASAVVASRTSDCAPWQQPAGGAGQEPAALHGTRAFTTSPHDTVVVVPVPPAASSSADDDASAGVITATAIALLRLRVVAAMHGDWSISAGCEFDDRYGGGVYI
jgi:hypothetical protein